MRRNFLISHWQSFAITLVVVLFACITALSASAQERRYILFTHPPVQSKAHYQEMINELQNSGRFLFVRPNLNIRHVYAELRPGAGMDLEVLNELLSDYGVQIGCFTKGVITREPIEYFDLKDCEQSLNDGPE
jgi:hypothetical protein